MSEGWKIWKFPLPVDTDRFEIAMPAAVHLSLQVQNDVPCLWAAVMPGTAEAGDRQPRQFLWVRTGQRIPDDVGAFQQSFVGTVQLHGGALVLHLFWLIPGIASPDRFMGRS